MDLDATKTVDLVTCQQQKHIPACASAQSTQRLDCSLSEKYSSPTCSMRYYNILANFSVTEHADLSLIWSENRKSGFLVIQLRLIFSRRGQNKNKACREKP